jgi:N-acetylneuraminic acid mutarotase
MLGSDVIADLNATIGMDRLSEEVITKLDQNVSGGAGVVAGSLVSVPYGQSAPDGYSLYQQGTPKELVWEEKAPVSVARYAYDGVEVLDGKIYFVGGHDGSNKNIAERYDPATNTWGTLASMSVARGAVATAILNGKLYAIGGQGVASVEVYDPSTESWSAGVALPSEVNHGTAITVNEKIYLIGGRNASEQNMNQVLCLDPFTNQWSTKANMPTARHGAKLVWFEDRIWAIGGRSPNMSKVESYNPITDSWQTEVPLSANRGWPVAWVASGRIFVGGGDNGSYLSSIETYNPTAKQWSNLGNLPENKFVADAVVLNDQVYVIAGQTASGVYSNKVYAADLNASVAGVYDLYRKDGNASAGTPLVQAEVADGSVTASKMADGAVSKSALDATILKYLKPEITSQPHAQMFYEGGNISLSITAEGKYLTYQWKKDGVDLTGETNATLKITDANATLHDGNYSVVVRNTFGSLESNLRFIDVNQSWKKDGLIAWLPFDGNSSDMSDNKNNAIVSGNPTWSDGKISQAINLNGSDQFINLTLECPITFSISCWIKTSDDAAAITGVDQSFVYWLDNYKLRFEVNNGTWKQPITYNVANTWTFTVAIYDSILNESIIYKDGDFFSKRVILNKINNSNHFVIGKKPLGSGRFFQGLIDDFRIYDRALSAAEVQALYNMGQ